jgi:nucleotide-binding universal stress UspA family protein
MNYLFNKIGLAITFSPTGKALLKETKRLKELFNSNLVLIHVGQKDSKSENLLIQTINNAGLELNQIEIIWVDDEPAHGIINSCKKASVDLLIAGALEKEKFIKFYLGSVARTIMRSAESSVLILKTPSENPKRFKKFFVSTDFTSESERAIISAYNFALKEKAEEFTIVHDFHIPGLASTVLDSGSIEEAEKIRTASQEEEEKKLRLFIKDLNLTGIKIEIKCLYGKEGWESSNYARQNGADIFVVSAPIKKMNILDKFFPREVEYSFENLPSNLLIVR